MGIKPNLTLIEKIIPHTISKNAAFRNVKNVNISYKHNENRFIVKLQAEKPQHNEGLKSTEKFDSYLQHSFDVERNKFIENVLRNKERIEPREYSGKKIVIDYSSPNIAKPFHAGHLRSTIIGNFISNIHQHFHNKVTKINYLGDWGTQFGLLQYGLTSKNININELQNNPIQTLYDVYVHANKLASKDEDVKLQARKFFSDIEQGRTSLDNWKKIRKVTVHELGKIYNRLGITFDAYHWESDYNGGAIKDIINLLETENIIRTDESGKKVATVKNKDVTVLKSDKSTLYISRDIAALLDRYKKYDFDKMLYVVDNSQTDHFAAVFEVVGRINKKCADGCEHIKFGRIKGMSTRTGNVVFLNDILDEAKQKMHEKQLQSKNTRSSAMNEKTCDILGTSAVVINDLKQRRQKDYDFDWNRVLQSEGDSGIKLQYLHCRLWSLEQNCGIQLPEECNPSYLTEEIIGDVIGELAKFEYVLEKSLTEYEACVLVNYLFRLNKHVNRMFNELRVKDVDADLAAQRLLIFHSAREVIKTSLEILGVRPLYEM
ncbi:probable arginine--tRNA ligase, mitochondrial [Manduca sexta]|uniref:probable arginine--tRNA ligase, mitochondrial n=1 Tax=Manduca sexta TaxID=7130 RepID=UPI00188EAF4F|nr:probable arginine--tRNA ligase, mitochondrial [Manduca sexta]